MPWHDWQFWVVTAAMAVSAALLLRQVFPKSTGSCPSCASGSAACALKNAAGKGPAAPGATKSGQPTLVQLGRSRS